MLAPATVVDRDSVQSMPDGMFRTLFSALQLQVQAASAENEFTLALDAYPATGRGDSKRELH